MTTKLEPTPEQRIEIEEVLWACENDIAKAAWDAIAPMVLEAAAAKCDELTVGAYDEETSALDNAAREIRAMKGGA